MKIPRLFALALASTFSLLAHWHLRLVDGDHPDQPTNMWVAPGYRAVQVCKLPEPAVAFRVDPESERVFMGTAGSADIYVYDGRFAHLVASPFALGIGDLRKGGYAEVNALSFVDIDGDGHCELLAATSQVMPRASPTIGAWKLNPSPRLLATVKPKIDSSWSHGLAPVPAEPGQTVGLLSTHCGNGEVVEYRFDDIFTDDGRRLAGLGWQKIAALPASGESIASYCLPGGEVEVCIAVGYAPGKAQLRRYRSEPNDGDPSAEHFITRGRRWRLREMIDEHGRFSNVRFAVDAAPNATAIIAFWTTENVGGHCEIYRYAIDAVGKQTRQALCNGPSDLYFPLENQIALINGETGASSEIWFAASAGKLWKHCGFRAEPAKLILTSPDGLGPLALMRNHQLLIASAISVLRLSCNCEAAPP